MDCKDPFPKCPSCDPDNETCVVIGASCDICPYTQCTKIGPNGPSATPSSSSQKKGSSATAAIAAGVVGGVIVIVFITFMVWRFSIKGRKKEFEETEWRKSRAMDEKDLNDFAGHRDARASTHTVGSIASTVLTRASNIIQIAYIPGVTNRSVESSPDLLIPPVPPIPAASAANSASSTPQPGQEQHFFMPSDLRDSRYSGYTDDNRTSFAPTTRSSVATTIYRNNAVVNPLPAQIIARGKASAVSVKSSGKNSPIGTPGSVTPPMPAIDFERHGIKPVNSSGPVVARLGVPKAVNVMKPHSSNSALANSPTNPAELPSNDISPITSPSLLSPSVKLGRRVSTQNSNRHNGDSSTFEDASTDDDDESPANRSLMGHDRERASQNQGWGPAELSATRLSGFKSPHSVPDLRHSKHLKSSSASSTDSQSRNASNDALKQSHKRSGSLNQIIEEATRRASRDPRHGWATGGWGQGGEGVGSLASWRKEGPFSDANAASTP